MSAKATMVVDARGLLCPAPVAKASQAVKKIRGGEVLEILATDPASKLDLASWASMTGNELIDTTEEEGNPRVYRFRVRKSK